MEIIYTDCRIENYSNRSRSVQIPSVQVDTGSLLTWVPREQLEEIGITCEKKDRRFQMSNGQTLTRSIGFAVVRVGDTHTIDEVVFAEPGDLALLGARTLEGLQLMIDPAGKWLVAAGPHLAASITPH